MNVTTEALPGHFIRRLQQAAVAIFMEETAEFNITPVQFAALQAVQRQPLIDQRTLAAAIGYDTSTIGGVVDRLEKRGLMQREVSAQDRRVRQLQLTAEGRRVLMLITPPMLRAQDRILAPLPEAERAVFMRMLLQLVAAHQDLPGAAAD